LIDLGLFRAGGDDYPTYGVTTLEARHVRIRDASAHFRYQAKGGIERTINIDDPGVVTAVKQLRRYRKGGDRLLAFRDRDGWHEIHAGDLNAYLRATSGVDMTAKDLRTWRATVL